MVILGSNSEVAQAFIEKYLSSGEKIKNLYLPVDSLLGCCNILWQSYRWQ